MSTLNAAKSQYAAEREGRMANLAMQPTMTTVSKGATPGFADQMISAIPGYVAGGGFKGALSGLLPQGQQVSGGQDTTMQPQQQTAPFPVNSFDRNVYQTGTPEEISASLSNIYQPSNPFQRMLKDQLEGKKKRLGGGIL